MTAHLFLLIYRKGTAVKWKWRTLCINLFILFFNPIPNLKSPVALNLCHNCLRLPNRESTAAADFGHGVHQRKCAAIFPKDRISFLSESDRRHTSGQRCRYWAVREGEPVSWSPTSLGGATSQLCNTPWDSWSFRIHALHWDPLLCQGSWVTQIFVSVFISQQVHYYNAVLPSKICGKILPFILVWAEPETCFCLQGPAHGMATPTLHVNRHGTPPHEEHFLFHTSCL